MSLSLGKKINLKTAWALALLSLGATVAMSTDLVVKTRTLNCYGSGVSTQNSYRIKMDTLSGSVRADFSDLERALRELKTHAPNLDVDSCLQQTESEIIGDPTLKVGLNSQRVKVIAAAIQQIQTRVESDEVRSSGSLTVGAAFSCKQSSDIKPKVESRFLSLKITPGNPPTLESKSLTRLLDDINKVPDVDYYACLTRLKTNIWRHISHNAYFNSAPPAPSLSSLNQLISKTLDPQISQDGELLSKGDPRKPIVPLSNETLAPKEISNLLRRPLNEESAAKIVSKKSLDDQLPKALAQLSGEEKISAIHTVQRAIAMVGQANGTCKKPNSPCASALQQTQAANQKIATLVDSAIPEARPSKTQVSADCPNCGVEDQGSSVKLELPQVDVSSCAQLKIGEASLANSHSFEVMREKDATDGRPSYVGLTNVQFTDSNGNSVQSDGEAIQERCMKELAPSLLGPNGEHITFRVWKSGDPEPKPAVTQIKVYPEQPWERGGDSGHWSETMSCPIILHETLHQYGLPDEYSESWEGIWVDPDGTTVSKNSVQNDPQKNKPADHPDAKFLSYDDCRAIGPEDSIMSQSEEAASNSSPGYEIDSCVCDGALATCRKEVASIASVPPHCPANMSRIHLPQVVSAYDYSTKENLHSSFQQKINPWLSGKTSATELNGEFYWVKKVSAKRPSILYPAQFRMVVFPDCKSATGTYQACEQNAYRSSTAHGGEGCGDMPDICKHPNEWVK